MPPDASARPVLPSSAIESFAVAPLLEAARAAPTPVVPSASGAVIPLPRAAAALSSDRASIERVLEAYRDAYDRLDASSAAVIWPRVDTRALSRAFSTLSSQDVSFDSCALDIAGAQAKAQCVGAIRYVRRLGDQTPRERRLSWSFALERVSDRWQIAHVNAD
jgi:hypothetical protein